MSHGVGEDAEHAARSPEAVLRTVFGHRAFRGPQNTIIQHILQGGDAVVLMPTGAGKSLCYQIPALCRPGTGLVISPLVALMRAQVADLQARGVAAAALHADLAPGEADAVLTRLHNGTLDLLYVAPERAASPAFLGMLGTAPLSLIAVDEAHCVSQWGHDFRPAYQNLGALFSARSGTPRLALTGTADHRTREDIKRHLWMDQARDFRSGFGRPNIALSVLKDSTGRMDRLLGLLARNGDRPALIYCRSRKATEQIAKRLSQKGLTALAYHAGLPAPMRQAAERAFMAEPGVVMAATVAFGMGMNRSDIGLVVHWDVPDSLEAYWQEVGRAGRDGQPAQAVLAYGVSELIALRRRALTQPDNLLGTHPGTQARLDAMIAYGEATACRAQAVAHYFGEMPGAPCGICDLCQSTTHTVDGRDLADRVLRLVADAPRPPGPTALVKRLSTDGPPAMWQSILRQLLARDMLAPAGPQTAGLMPTPLGYDLLARRAAFPILQDWPDTGDSPPGAASLEERIPDIALTTLRQIRDALAQDQGIPALLICHDRTLEAMAREKPQCLTTLGALPGMGTQKAARFGQAFLDALKAA